jgi:Zn-dependent peptidase ImmA (M78 family)
LTRVAVRPEMLEWAIERAGFGPGALHDRFPQLASWQSRETIPTFKQLERFAATTHTPFGYFFLAEPPVETVPIPDFRTIGSKKVKRPSPNLLDTVYLCQQRQDWYREYARNLGEPALRFVGSATTASDVVRTAATIRRTLKLDLTERRNLPTWEDALRRLIEQSDEAGVLVMVSGVVGHNSHRPLDPDEFRGFALADDLSPLAFVNGADTKSAQMFTLVHELAHLWLGRTGLSDVTPLSRPSDGAEQWCNGIAAEVLVPLAAIKAELRPGAKLAEEVTRLTRQFKVSSLVILRRIHDAGSLSRPAFTEAHEAEVARLQDVLAKRRSGGNYYLTTASRVSKRFARAVLASTWEGRSSFTEAFRLLGCKNTQTLNKLGASLGVA